MVVIAIAGSTGEVAQEIIDALYNSIDIEFVYVLDLADGDSHLLGGILKDVSTLPQWAGTQSVQVDYSDKQGLTDVLQRVEVVLSFITPQTDPGNEAQLNLIDASIAAGVKRFAPSEWATSSVECMPWYAGKQEIRQYLEKVNKEKQRIEYTLFQPGLFLNYLTHPHKSAEHVHSFQTQFDFENRRAIVPDPCEDVVITLTTVQDLANVVAKAVEYEGVWPVVGGVKGCGISIQELIHLGEEIRGGPFSVDKLDVDTLHKGIENNRWSGSVRSTWLPKVDHPAIPSDQASALAEMFLVGMTLGMSKGVLHVSAEWNDIFPEYEFTQPREFLSGAWQGKP